jgi:hypothetical protein
LIKPKNLCSCFKSAGGGKSANAFMCFSMGEILEASTLWPRKEREEEVKMHFARFI